MWTQLFVFGTALLFSVDAFAQTPFWKDTKFLTESVMAEKTVKKRIEKVDEILTGAYSNAQKYDPAVVRDFLRIRALECPDDLAACSNVARVAAILCRQDSKVEEFKRQYWQTLIETLAANVKLSVNDQVSLANVLKGCSKSVTLGQMTGVLQVLTGASAPHLQPLRNSLLGFFTGKQVDRPVKTAILELLVDHLGILGSQSPVPLAAIEQLLLAALDRTQTTLVTGAVRSMLLNLSLVYLPMTGHANKLELLAQQSADLMKIQPTLAYQFASALCDYWLTTNRIADCRTKTAALKILPPFSDKMSFQVTILESSIDLAQSQFDAALAKLKSAEDTGGKDLGEGRAWLILKLAFAQLGAQNVAEAKKDILRFDSLATGKSLKGNPWVPIYRQNFAGQVLITEKNYKAAEIEYTQLRGKIEKAVIGTSDMLAWTDLHLLFLAGQRRDKIAMAAIHKRLEAETSGRPALAYVSKLGDITLKASNQQPTTKEFEALRAQMGARHPEVLRFESYAALLKPI